jgi:hypothetical protein
MSTAPGFPNVRSDERGLMIELLAGRPDNQQLAQEFRDLANNRRFQTDLRNSRKMIFDVESRVP